VAQQLSALRFFFSRRSNAPGCWRTCRCPRNRSAFPTSCREKKWNGSSNALTALSIASAFWSYATGVRREELVRLKIEDIDSARMLIHIRQGKGRKDRNVMLSPRLLAELRDYWRSANPKPKTYLFPSQAANYNADLPMSDRTVWSAVREAATRAGLEKRVHPHTLRHYAASRTMPHVEAPAADLGHFSDDAAA
jgi:integrase/recombinase XerD